MARPATINKICTSFIAGAYRAECISSLLDYNGVWFTRALNYVFTYWSFKLVTRRVCITEYMHAGELLINIRCQVGYSSLGLSTSNLF